MSVPKKHRPPSVSHAKSAGSAPIETHFRQKGGNTTLKVLLRFALAGVGRAAF